MFALKFCEKIAPQITFWKIFFQNVHSGNHLKVSLYYSYHCKFLSFPHSEQVWHHMQS